MPHQTQAKRSLSARLCDIMPRGTYLKCYHVATAPIASPPLFHPPPGRRPEKTWCEEHFFLMTSKGEMEVALFALEIKIYRTKWLNTAFVSKADSTGLGHNGQYGISLSKLSLAILEWTMESVYNEHRRSLLCLFARSQRQYLFPGSEENKSKHILDDRSLVKWWCRTLDPLIKTEGGTKGYLIVPGHDDHETFGFLPHGARSVKETRRWIADHPLEIIARNPAAPPRCLVPHFLDDPKARFLDDLDDELANESVNVHEKHRSPTKRGTGRWKSVATLKQFWDHLQLRQECSSGNLTGFIWIVHTPLKPENQIPPTDDTQTLKAKRERDFDVPRSKRRRLTGPLQARPPRVKVLGHDVNALPSVNGHHGLEETLVVTSKGYKRLHERLLRLDFTGLRTASKSTRTWLEEAAVEGASSEVKWGLILEGQGDMKQNSSSNAPIHSAHTLVARKK